MNYLQLVNRVLSDLNEVEISDVSSTRGVQTTAKNAVDSAMRDIYNEETEWSFLHSDNTDTVVIGEYEYDVPSDARSVDWDNFFLRPLDLVSNGDFTSDLTGWDDISAGTGAIAYSSSGNGRMRLTGDGTNAGAAEQALSTVVNKEYHLTFRHYNNDVTIKIGTSSGATDITSQSETLTYEGQGDTVRVVFTATSTTTYVGFANTSTTYTEVDQVAVRRNINPTKLKYLSYDEYVRNYRDISERAVPTSYGVPEYVYKTQDDKYGLYPTPDEGYQIAFEYWAQPSDLSSNTDEPVIPTRYHDVIISGAKMYVLELRADPVFRDRLMKRFENGIERMRTDLINRPDYIKAV